MSVAWWDKYATTTRESSTPFRASAVGIEVEAPRQGQDSWPLRKYATARTPLKRASTSPATLRARSGQRPARSRIPNTHSSRPTALMPAVGSRKEVNCSINCFAGEGARHFRMPASKKTVPTSRSQTRDTPPPPREVASLSAWCHDLARLGTIPAEYHRVVGWSIPRNPARSIGECSGRRPPPLARLLHDSAMGVPMDAGHRCMPTLRISVRQFDLPPSAGVFILYHWQRHLACAVHFVMCLIL